MKNQNEIQDAINLFFTSSSQYIGYLSPYAAALVCAVIIISLCSAIYLFLKSPYSGILRYVLITLKICLSVVFISIYAPDISRLTNVKVNNDVAVINYLTEPSVKVSKNDVKEIEAYRVKVMNRSETNPYLIDVYCRIYIHKKDGNTVLLELKQPGKSSHFCKD